MWHSSEGTHGLPWCLLHGFAASAESWRPTLDALPNPPTAYRANLPGHAGLPFDCSDFAGCVKRLNDTLPTSEPVHLIGYSLGGRVALGWACAHPKRIARLTLIGAHPGLASDEDRTHRRTTDAKWSKVLRSEGIEAFVSAWESQPIFASQASLPDWVQAQQRAIRLSHDPHQLADAMDNLGLGAMPDFHSHLPTLSMPVTLITGAADTKFRALAESMRDAIPNATHTPLPGGHNVPLESPQELSRALANA